MKTISEFCGNSQALANILEALVLGNKATRVHYEDCRGKGGNYLAVYAVEEPPLVIVNKVVRRGLGEHSEYKVFGEYPEIQEFSERVQKETERLKGRR